MMTRSFDEIFVAMDQIGIIAPIEHVEEMRKNLIEVFDIDPEKVSGGNMTRHKNTVFRGKKADVGPAVRMDFLDKFPLQLEYLSPIDGESAWMEYHKKVDRGMHHVRFNVSSHEEAKQYLHEHGIEIYHEADSPRGENIKFGYYDSYEKLGFYIETINFAEVENNK